MSNGPRTGDTRGIHKYLREFDSQGKEIREREIAVSEWSGGGWSPRADDLVLGFRRQRSQLEYTYWVMLYIIYLYVTHTDVYCTLYTRVCIQ